MGSSGKVKMENICNTLILAGGVVTALSVIIAGVIKIVKTVKKPIETIDNIHKEVIEIKNKQGQSDLAILRLNIVSEEMPLSERLAAGKEYIAKGGNGGVKHLYSELYEKVNGEKPDLD